MSEQEFFAKAMIAAMQGLLSSVGNGFQEEYANPHGTVAAMAKEYAEELTTRYVIASAILNRQNQDSCQN
jgi:hypothetical protein